MIDWVNTAIVTSIFLSTISIVSVFSDDDFIKTNDNIEKLIHLIIFLIPIFNIIVAFLAIKDIIEKNLLNKKLEKKDNLPKNLQIIIDEIIENHDYEILDDTLYNQKLNIHIGQKRITTNFRSYETNKYHDIVEKIINDKLFEKELKLYLGSK